MNSSKSRKYECDADRPKERVSVFKMGPSDQERKSLRNAQTDKEKAQIDNVERALAPPAIAPEELSFKTPYAMFRCKSPLRTARKKYTGDVELTVFDSVKVNTAASKGNTDHLIV